MIVDVDVMAERRIAIYVDNVLSSTMNFKYLPSEIGQFVGTPRQFIEINDQVCVTTSDELEWEGELYVFDKAVHEARHRRLVRLCAMRSK